jgi:hypothetical protein
MLVVRPLPKNQGGDDDDAGRGQAPTVMDADGPVQAVTHAPP